MIQLLLDLGSNPAISDSLGNPCLVYALKSNDETFISRLVDMLKVTKRSFDSEEVENMLKHVIALEPSNELSFSYNNDKLLRRLVNTVLDLTKAKDKHALLSMASRLGADQIGNFLSQQFKVPFIPSLLLPPRQEAERGWHCPDPPDSHKDAEKMMTLLEQKLEKIRAKGEIQWSQPGCTVTDGHIHNNYNILLSKVDVGFGAFGLYNFYRIQVWKETHKPLWVLFTNWGRIGSWGHGQYQNTPFSTAAEAEKEFRKIFQSKTGNDWDSRNDFENKPKKYRIVAAEHATKIIRPAVQFIWTTKKMPELPYDNLILLKDLTDIKMLRVAYNQEVQVDTSAVPFGRIKKSALLKAQNLLEDLLPLIKRREALDAQNMLVDPAGSSNPSNVFDQLDMVLSEICQLSSEFHYLVPQKGLDYERVQPVDSMQRYDTEKQNLELLLDFEFTESIILGAMLHREKVHPLTYVYKALDCQLQTIEESSLEAQMVLQYMYRSKGAALLRVESIYKVQRAAEADRFHDLRAKRRKLLWHGTKRSHLLREETMLLQILNF